MTTEQAFRELGQAFADFGHAVAEALHLEKIVRWLDRELSR